MPIASVNPATGADNRIPDSWLTNSRPYFTSWQNANGHHPTRWHWGRLAVNPHNVGGAPMPVSAAPSYCLGQPQVAQHLLHQRQRPVHGANQQRDRRSRNDQRLGHI